MTDYVTTVDHFVSQCTAVDGQHISSLSLAIRCKMYSLYTLSNDSVIYY